MIKAVIFDIDDTLTTEKSWVKIVDAVGASREEEYRIYMAGKEGLITSEAGAQKVLELWTRKGPVHKKRFEEVFQAIPLRPDAQDLVEYLKRKNILLCMITGAMDLYAQIISQRLGIENYYVNANLIWDEQGNIKHLTWHSNDGALKLRQFREFIAAHGLRAEECAVAGDSENDRLLFLETKNGIAVRTAEEDKELEKIAWKIVDNLAEIKALI